VEFSCATLTVPLDHPGVRPGPDRPGHLELSVAVSDNVRAPLGILIRLVGGPGEPGLPLAADISAHEIEPAVRQAYRLVFINQRGTGPGALQCPQLQQALGDSDLTVPPAAAVQSCADALGDARRFYTTADTVADLESLRIALRAPQLTLDGTSYGSFVAARYALAYPNRVSRLVLDSVVPHDGLDPLQLAAFARAGPVLAMACRETGCTTDPAGDLASVVRKRHDGPQLLDVLTGLTAGKPRLAQLPAALHAAASGDYTELDAISQAELHDAATPAEHLSQGLHTATACEDLTSTGPWGDAATPVLGRRKSIAKAVAALPEQTFFPFDRDTATGNGTMVTCQQWPSTPVPAFVVGRDLPPVPVLLLAGDHDLDTPLAWTRQEAARAPRGQLIVIPGSGHITQDAANGPAGREAAARFLTSPP
jgi:pimeloyl-ACP methyl ester carboxylesterase